MYNKRLMKTNENQITYTSREPNYLINRRRAVKAGIKYAVENPSPRKQIEITITRILEPEELAKTGCREQIEAYVDSVIARFGLDYILNFYSKPEIVGRRFELKNFTPLLNEPTEEKVQAKIEVSA